MGEKTKTIRKTVVFMLASTIFMMTAFIISNYSESVVQDALTGAIVGALSGLITCLAICKLGNRLMPQADTRHSRAGVVTNAIIGGYVDLIATSVLVTLSLTVLGAINDIPTPFLWAALISGLGGWILGALIGGLIGAGWERV